MPARQKYRLRARSDREIVREVEPGVTYVDAETGEEFQVVGAALPLAPSPSDLPYAVENLRLCGCSLEQLGPERPERLPTLRPAASGRRALSLGARLLPLLLVRGHRGLRRRRRAGRDHPRAARPFRPEAKPLPRSSRPSPLRRPSTRPPRRCRSRGRRPPTPLPRTRPRATRRRPTTARPSASRSTATRILAPAADLERGQPSAFSRESTIVRWPTSPVTWNGRRTRSVGHSTILM